MDRKYEINSGGRVTALRDFGNVVKGDIGGFIESEKNLSHEGDCWIYGNASISGGAKLSGDAKVYDHAQVFGDAWVCGSARIYGHAHVSGNSFVCSHARVFGAARVYGSARVSNYAHVSGSAHLFGDAQAYGYARVGYAASVSGDAQVAGIFRLDGHIFCYVSCADKKHRVIAGCRYFTMSEAREFWWTTHEKHSETYALLSVIETLSKLRPEGCV